MTYLLTAFRVTIHVLDTINRDESFNINASLFYDQEKNRTVQETTEDWNVYV